MQLYISLYFSSWRNKIMMLFLSPFLTVLFFIYHVFILKKFLQNCILAHKSFLLFETILQNFWSVSLVFYFAYRKGKMLSTEAWCIHCSIANTNYATDYCYNNIETKEYYSCVSDFVLRTSLSQNEIYTKLFHYRIIF